MTLLEAFTALVILGLTAVAYLTLFDGSTSAARRADASSHLVAYAQAALAEETLHAGGATTSLPRGLVRRVERRPWRPGVAELVITVRNADGDSLRLHRLVRAP